MNGAMLDIMVRSVCALYAKGMTPTQIAKACGAPRAKVSAIIKAALASPARPALIDSRRKPSKER
jgi:transcriptional regulator